MARSFSLTTSRKCSLPWQAWIGRHLLNNVLVLAKAAKIFGLPVILTSVESKGFSGNITPQLLDVFSGQTPIERSSMNAWDSKEFVAAVKKTGRKNLIMAALWSEVCLAMPALQALTDGYAVYAVEDACGGDKPGRPQRRHPAY